MGLTPDLAELKRIAEAALRCLYLEAPESVVKDVSVKVEAVFDAQAARIEALEAESRDLTKALTGLTCGGSEFFIRKGERYVADIKACVEWVQRRDRVAHDRIMKVTAERDEAKARAANLLGDRHD